MRAVCLLFLAALSIGVGTPAFADVEPWQVAVRPTFAGCDSDGRNVYRVSYANDMYDNPEKVTVTVNVWNHGKIQRHHKVTLPPYASKVRYYRVYPGGSKRFVSKVNGEVATTFTMEGLPCK